MHEIPMAYVTPQFAKCWQQAGIHLENAAGGAIHSWLRAHLDPPFREHLSFRLGNQLFFVQIEDVDGQLETPGTRAGLLRLADEARGHACRMPMKQVAGRWQAMAPGWGLLDARSGQGVNPPALITDEPVEMTDWEVHDMAVQMYRSRLEEQGRVVATCQSDLEVNPTLWLADERGELAQWVIVRGVRLPGGTRPTVDSLAPLVQTPTLEARSGFLGVVTVAYAGKRQGNTRLLRGEAMEVEFPGGLQAMR